MRTTLVSGADLARHPEWRAFDCRQDLARPGLGEQQYREGHIPGALFAHLDRDLSAPTTGNNGRHPLPEPADFIAWLGAAGPRRARPAGRARGAARAAPPRGRARPPGAARPGPGAPPRGEEPRLRGK